MPETNPHVFGGNIAAVIIGIIVLIYIFKVWKQNKNPIDFATFVLVSALLLIRFFRALDDLFGMFEIDITPYLSVQYLSIFDVLYMIYGVVFGWFILFIYGFKRSYTLPYVAGFFLEMYIMVTDNRVPHNVFVTLIVLAASGILLVNAIKNHSGISFSIVLGAVIGVLEFYIEVWWLTFALPFIVFIVLYTGVNGWWDEHVFYDRNKRKEIQNSWISKVVK